MNKILILTDFSDVSALASHYAMQLAAKVNAELHFLHIISTPVDWLKLSRESDLNSPHVLLQEEEAEEKLRELTREAQMLGLPSRFHIAYNRPNFDFVDHVNTISCYDISFSIVGSHGASGLKELFIGSNAQKVIRHSRCPVLVIKKMPKKIVPEQIVFISLFKECDLKAFQKLLSLANIFRAGVKLLYVKTPFQNEHTDTIKCRIQNFMKKACGKMLEYRIEFGKWSEDGVLDYITRNDTELIAISTEGRTGLSRIVRPSFAESLVNHVPIPVLSILKYENKVN